MKRTRKCLIEMDKVRRKLDGVVHKPNYLRARCAVKTANPTSMKIIQQIKKMLDPNGILNPGQGI
jgi:FAD/FMN-containing dehydrogenase